MIEWCDRILRARILNNLGALACISAVDVVAKPSQCRFPEWEKHVARPVFAVVDAPNFFDHWDEAGEEDIISNAPTGLDKLLHAITLMSVTETPEFQPPRGTWFTAREIIDDVADVIMGGALTYGTGPPTIQELSGYLRRHRDVKVADRYTLHASQMDLGNGRLANLR